MPSYGRVGKSEVKKRWPPYLYLSSTTATVA